MDITNKTVFARLADHIRTERYTDSDLFDLIGNYAGVSPVVSQALAFHARDISAENAKVDLTYTELVVQIYYRTFFSPEHAGKYGTDQMVHMPDTLRSFVEYVIDPSSSEPPVELPFENAPLVAH